MKVIQAFIIVLAFALIVAGPVSAQWDWSAMLSPITSNMDSYIYAAVVGLLALIAAPILIRAAVGVGAMAIKYVFRIFS